MDSWPRRDWDDEFANMAYAKDAEQLPSIWTERANTYRITAGKNGVRIDSEVSYGQHPRETFDLVWPHSPPLGLVIFIHGGYWMKFDKSYWTHLAEGARQRGWAVCIPSYTLAPEQRIGATTRQIARVINHVSALVDGPIRLAGHSAGGHLASRMLCEDSALEQAVFERIEHTMSISGVHDLRPLLHTQMNQTLNLDTLEAGSESTVLQHPKGYSRLTCWVGGAERPEFIRQSKLMVQMWSGLDVNADCTVEPMHNHFTVIDALENADSDITRALLG